MRTVAIIIARMGSTRLPGKVLMDLAGLPVLAWVVDRAKLALFVDEVVVATSTLPGDDAIMNWCMDRQVRFYRGSETDVLARVYGAAIFSQAQVVIRITGDCPFIDPDLIGQVAKLREMTGAAYVSNIQPRTWPDGLDCEAFTFEALEAAHKEATRPIDRECVTTWIQRNRSRFPAESVVCPLPGLEQERWVLDTENDLQFCRGLMAEVSHYPFGYLDLLVGLKRKPWLRDINKHHPTNERYFEALANEEIYPRTYARSQAQFEKARKIIPLAAQTFSKSYLQYPQPGPLFLSHGDGGLCWDIDGNEYVDLVSALLPNILGYCDPEIDGAVRRQMAAGVSFSLATELEEQLASTLCRLIPSAEMVRFGKTGTDVTSAAVRLARAVTDRDLIYAPGGYHGWQDWSMAGVKERRAGIPPELSMLITRGKYGDIAEAEKRLESKRYAAVIVEPEDDGIYLAELRELCTRTGTALIFDEVITGFRFHLGGAQAHWDVKPDLACFGKALANGYPLSALVGRSDYMHRMEPPNNIFFSGTFFGEALSLAAAIATIGKMERENVIDKLWWWGGTLRTMAEKAIHDERLTPYIQFHGCSPLVRITFVNDKIAALFRKEMIAAGVLIIASHNLCHAHTEGDIRRIARAYRHAARVVGQAIDSGDVDDRLAGSMVAAGVR